MTAHPVLLFVQQQVDKCFCVTPRECVRALMLCSGDHGDVHCSFKSMGSAAAVSEWWFHGHLPDFPVWNNASIYASEEAVRHMKVWHVDRFNLQG